MMKKHRSQKPSPNEVNDRVDRRTNESGKKQVRLIEMSRSERVWTFYTSLNSSAFFPLSGIMGVRREERREAAKRFEKSTAAAAAVSSSQKKANTRTKERF